MFPFVEAYFTPSPFLSPKRDGALAGKKGVGTSNRMHRTRSFSICPSLEISRVAIGEARVRNMVFDHVIGKASACIVS